MRSADGALVQGILYGAAPPSTTIPRQTAAGDWDLHVVPLTTPRLVTGSS